MAKLIAITTTENRLTHEGYKKVHDYIERQGRTPSLLAVCSIEINAYHEKVIADKFGDMVALHIKELGDDTAGVIYLSSSLLFNKLRLMVKEGALEPFEVLTITNGDILTSHVDKNGRMDFWPDGVFDTERDIIADLL